MVKLPPQAIEIEQSILSTCLMYPDSITAIEDYLRPDDFYKTAHAIIYETMLALSRDKNPVDTTTVITKLKDTKNLVRCGGASYLAELIDSPVSPKIEKSAKILREKHALRQTIKICNNAINDCFENNDALQIIDKTQTEINNLDIAGKENVAKVSDLVIEAMDRFDAMKGSNKRLTGCPSGFKLLDYMTCGWQKSDLIIIAARPSMGKTSLVMSFDFRVPTAIFSLEMSNQQLTDKLLAKYSHVNGQKFRSGNFTTEDWEKITNASDKVYSFPLYIDDSPALHYLEIRRRARKYKKKYRIKQIIIDHLQLMRGDNTSNRDREIGSITAGLKALAKDLQIPVILLSQLNRKLEDRGNKRPKLSDLRDSGNIEQDSDVVCFLYRDEVYNKKTDDAGIAELNIAKQRNGPTGMIKLAWLKDYATFENLEREVQ